MAKRKHYSVLIGLIIISLLATYTQQILASESELVASLETLDTGVSIKRADTADWVQIQYESLIGVGDMVQTGPKGRARIIFFSDGIETEVQPNSEFRIDKFRGDQDKFEISVTVLVGQTKQRVKKLLDSGSSYTVNSAGIEMAIRGTEFDVRVEKSGRSATIVHEGLVRTTANGASAANDKATAAVPAGYGVRAEPDEELSDVVKASTFEQLDAALDGCVGVTNSEGDVRLNVRTGPGLNYPRIGTLNPAQKLLVIGATETTYWFRVPFKGGYGWIYSRAIKLEPTCAGLRQFPDIVVAEDVTLYENLGDSYDVETPTPAPN